MNKANLEFKKGGSGFGYDNRTKNPSVLLVPDYTLAYFFTNFKWALVGNVVDDNKSLTIRDL